MKDINILEEYNYTCYIVGGGPSINNINLNYLNTSNHFVVAINNSYMLLPTANILYCTDDPWVAENELNLKNFKGIKYQGVLPHNKIPKSESIDKRWTLTGFDGIEYREDSLRHGSNSTYAALNLVTAHMGFRRVFLLGIDMKWGESGNQLTSHWHSNFKPHSRIDPETIYPRMISAYETIKPELEKLGVEVYNVNKKESTSLTTFPIISFNEMIEISDEAVNEHK